MDILKPTALARRDAIGVVAPAGPVAPERIDRALQRVRQRGFRIKTYGDIYRSQGYLAGDDTTRAEELMAAFADQETSTVWCARGGYGVVRLLDRLDFDLIRRNPKVFIGFSDITALHIAIQQQAGLVTFHAPNLQDGFGKTDDMPAVNEAALWRAVMNETQPPDRSGYEFDLGGVDRLDLQSLSSGVAAGPLIGGNLAVLCGLMGTPFEIDVKGRILFIEDVDERPYRIDRYLAQLALAGKLQQAAGVLVGTFSYEDDEPASPESAVMELLREYLGGLNGPVLAGFPAGHTPWNLALPCGVPIEMNADAARVTVLENAVV